MGTELNNTIIGTAILKDGREEARALRADSSSMVTGVVQSTGSIPVDEKWTVDSDNASPNSIRVKSERYNTCLGESSNVTSTPAGLQVCKNDFPLEKEFPSNAAGEFFIKSTTAGAEPLYMTMNTPSGNTSPISFERKKTSAQGQKTQKWKFNKASDR